MQATQVDLGFRSSVDVKIYRFPVAEWCRCLDDALLIDPDKPKRVENPFDLIVVYNAMCPAGLTARTMPALLRHCNDRWLRPDGIGRLIVGVDGPARTQLDFGVRKLLWPNAVRAHVREHLNAAKLDVLLAKTPELDVERRYEYDSFRPVARDEPLDCAFFASFAYDGSLDDAVGDGVRATATWADDVAAATDLDFIRQVMMTTGCFLHDGRDFAISVERVNLEKMIFDLIADWQLNATAAN